MSPYITPDRTDEVNSGATPRVPGELNYQITQACIEYLEDRIEQNQGQVNYEMLNTVIGALESAKTEFERRVVAPYEESKRYSNGDVYSELIKLMGIS